MGFPGCSSVKNPPANAGGSGSIAGLGRSPGEGNGSPFQYSCLGNPMNRGTWRATVHWGHKELDTTERLSRHAHICESIAEKVMAPHSSTLAGKIPWMEETGRLLSMGSLGVTHDFTFTFTFHFHALEKEMATHSSVLAWRIPGTGQPGGLPSMGSHRVEHD